MIEENLCCNTPSSRSSGPLRQHPGPRSARLWSPMPAVCGRPGSAEGLQHSLALLEQYWEEWALTLNLDKTRVMVFQKKARSQGSRYQFSYGGEVLEHSTSYSYLGIQISASGGLQSGCEGLVWEGTVYHQITVWPIKTTNLNMEKIISRHH